VTTDELKIALSRFGFDGSDPLQLWLEDAFFDVVGYANWPFLVSEYTNVVPAGEDTLENMPAVTKIISVRLRFDEASNYVKLKYMPIEVFDIEFPITLDGVPEAFTLIDNHVRLNRSLDQDMQLVLRYKRPITLGTEPQIPEPMHYAIVLRAAATGLQAENEEDRSASCQDQYDNAMARHISNFGGVQDTVYNTVVNAQGY
jgi:hypothetical protein